MIEPFDLRVHHGFMNNNFEPFGRGDENVDDLSMSPRWRRVTASIALALTAAACGTAAPAAADPRPCESIPGLCDIVSTTTSRHPMEDAVDFMRNNPVPPAPKPTLFETATAGLEHWYGWLAVLLVVAGAAMAAKGSGEHTVPEGRDPNGPAAVAARANTAGEKSLGWVMLATGCVLYAFAAWSLSATILVAVPAGIVATIGIASARKQATIASGAQHADRKYQQQVAAARMEAAGQPGEFDDLGLHISRSTQFTAPPEPVITPAEAQRLGESGGYTPVANSAAAVLLDRLGNDTPARDGLATVAQQLGWGAWAGSGDERVWEPYVTLDGVSYHPDGDADVRLAISHASVDENRIEKALPALLRTWGCRDGEVRREGGSVLIRVTNRSMKQRLREEQAESDAGEVWDF